jgi:regulator of sigma E protease
MTTLVGLFQWAPIGIPATLFLITVVVFFHELGHFLVARWCGVRVETFSIGFGPEVIGRTDSRGTRWKLSWVPLGGYVRFFGDADAASLPDREKITHMSADERRVSFPHKSIAQRAAIVAAGPIANFILAIVIFTGFFMFAGHTVLPPVVGGVKPHSAALAVGIKKGDIIRRINGEPIKEFDDIRAIVTLSAGQELAIDLERDGHLVAVHATPRMTRIKDPFAGDTDMLALGVQPDVNQKLTVERYGPIRAMGAATNQVWLIIHGTLSTVGQMVTGHASVSQMRGPLGMAAMAQKVASVSFLILIQLAAILSVSIGLINLFPIPMLDGGHLLYYACEVVLGRPLGERAQDVGYRLGLAAVLGLVLLVTWNDLVRQLNLF